MNLSNILIERLSYAHKNNNGEYYDENGKLNRVYRLKYDSSKKNKNRNMSIKSIIRVSKLCHISLKDLFEGL